MRKSISFILTLFCSLCVFASDNPPVPTGDDLFPWPWGTECPFPWQEIEGRYRVLSETERPYAQHMLMFSLTNEGGMRAPYLNISQYDERGRLFATGVGRADGDDKRIVRATMVPLRRGEANYSVVVRTYTAHITSAAGRGACLSSDLVAAVTFCPYRGRRCMQDSNYILQKID